MGKGLIEVGEKVEYEHSSMQREDQPSVRQSTHFLRVAAVRATNKNKWSAIWNAAQTSCVLTEGVGCSTVRCLGGGRAVLSSII